MVLLIFSLRSLGFFGIYLGGLNIYIDEVWMNWCVYLIWFKEIGEVYEVFKILRSVWFVILLVSVVMVV